MDNIYNFGEILRDLRNKKGLTQDELGELIGMKGTTVSKYETRPKPPDGTVIRKISNALGVSCDYLLGREPAGTISLYMLDEKQTLVVKDLVELFRDQNTRIASQLSDEQYKMIGRIVVCFLNKRELNR